MAVIGFMVVDGQIARVHVGPGSPILTLSGVGIGASEDNILAVYPGQLEVMPPRYVPEGNYWEFVPRDAVDSGYRVIFATAGGIVTEYRAGRLPEVSYVEGCN